MNEDFYYIEIWYPRGLLHSKVPAWLSFGHGYKWCLDECMGEALRRKKTHPRQKLRICRQIITRTEWKNRKSLK